ncbi:MAG: hypothetical protein HYV17_04135 [Xanthomonadales bacterium]|nr:hypothetical protein [Xanthomonadales bacterium]
MIGVELRGRAALGMPPEYLALCKITDALAITLIAVRHQREDDYRRSCRNGCRAEALRRLPSHRHWRPALRSVGLR